MAEKIAISLDRELLRDVESLRRKTKESRSAVFSRAVRLLLDSEAKQHRAEQYVKAYREQPETESEIAQAEALAKESLRALDWDE